MYMYIYIYVYIYVYIYIYTYIYLYIYIWPVAAGDAPELGLQFSTPEPRVERSMSLAYQPCSEPLHITAK